MFKKSRACIENESASLSINLDGGAIIDFQLKTTGINPLSFLYPNDLMPSNNKNGAAYQGHFLCLGRWGEPSSGEKMRDFLIMVNLQICYGKMRLQRNMTLLK